MSWLNKKLKNRKHTKLAQAILICLCLLLSFNNNFFKTVSDQYQFDVFLIDNQSLIWGRIAHSDQNGMFADGLFMGRCFPVPDDCEGNDSKCAKRYQKKIYLNKHKFEEYVAYESHPAFQTLFFTSINSIFNFDPNFSVSLFLFLTALINAIVVTVLIMTIFGRFGNFVTFFIAVALIFNYWFVCYGNELLMFFGFLLIPLIVSWRVFEKASIEKRGVDLRGFLYIFLAILIKCLFTGFEFISCAVLSVIVPVIFFSGTKFLELKKSFWQLILLGFASIAAILFTVGVLGIQIGGFSDFGSGIELLRSRFILRTVGVGVISQESLNIFSVLNTYFNIEAISFTESIHSSFKGILIIILIASLFLLLIKKHGKLIITSLVAFLVSISWLILFRQHAVVHPHINPIICYIPFLFFGFAIIGLAIQEMFFLTISKTAGILSKGGNEK
jgi:hypothetical protein